MIPIETELLVSHMVAVIHALTQSVTVSAKTNLLNFLAASLNAQYRMEFSIKQNSLAPFFNESYSSMRAIYSGGQGHAFWYI